MKNDLFTVYIYDDNDTLIDVAVTNEKGYKKSLENGNLWLIFLPTMRLLPFLQDVKYKKLELSEKNIFVYYESNSLPKNIENCRKPVEKVDNFTSNQELERLNETTIVTEQSLFIGESLLKLEKVISRRHKELPAGSYTTHLFTSGAEKIRKKTGEEAIELLLANSKENIIYEAADLIYHLMVLLESEDINLSQIIHELNGRP